MWIQNLKEQSSKNQQIERHILAVNTDSSPENLENFDYRK